jgi:hypothetical protein
MYRPTQCRTCGTECASDTQVDQVQQILFGIPAAAQVVFQLLRAEPSPRIRQSLVFLPPLKKTTVLELVGWEKKAILHDVIVDSGLVGRSPWRRPVSLVNPMWPTLP